MNSAVKISGVSSMPSAHAIRRLWRECGMADRFGFAQNGKVTCCSHSPRDLHDVPGVSATSNPSASATIIPTAARYLLTDGVGLPADVEWPEKGKLSALIVRSLRENAHAQLKVESEPGQGTKVTIQFTRAAAEVA